jgi:hypothetical protein
MPSDLCGGIFCPKSRAKSKCLARDHDVSLCNADIRTSDFGFLGHDTYSIGGQGYGSEGRQGSLPNTAVSQQRKPQWSFLRSCFGCVHPSVANDGPLHTAVRQLKLLFSAA